MRIGFVITFVSACAVAQRPEPAPPPSEPAAPPRAKPRAVVQYSSDLGEVDEPGKLTRREVDGVLKDQRRQFSGCYQRAVDRQTVTNARVVIAFAIGDDGTVTDAHVAETDSGDPALDRCLISVIEAVVFPEGSPTRVQYPFIFVLE